MLIDPQISINAECAQNGATEPKGRRLHFRLSRSGLISIIILAGMIILGICAEFVSPYAPNAYSHWPNVPPMMLRMHLMEEQVLRWPFVCGLLIERDPFTNAVAYAEDCSRSFPIRFWVHGEIYRLLGFFSTDLHLFGTGEDIESVGQFFIWGTDAQGRDILARTLAGARTSFFLCLSVVMLSLILAIPLGGLASYWGGWSDLLSQRLIEGLLAWPRMALILALSAILATFQVGPIERLWAMMLLLAIVSWVSVAQVLRGNILALREEPFLVAARALGAGELHILRKHLMPNVTGGLIVSSTLLAPNILVLESFLSYLGYGVPDTLVSWGSILRSVGEIHLLPFYPWWLIPAGFLVLTVLAFNLLGDALSDAMNPHRQHPGYSGIDQKQR